MVLSIRSDKYMKKRVTYTMIPQSRLAEQAINEYLKKMEKADN